MMNLESKEFVVQNLKDAGCNSKIIEDFLLYFEEHQKEKQIALLAAQRKELLNKVHNEERKIFCLDYLIYQLEK